MVTRMFLRRAFFRIMLVSLATAAAVSFFAVLFANYEFFWRVAATAFATALASGLMWRIERLLDNRSTGVSGLFGVAATTLCFLISLLAIWVRDHEPRWWATLFALAMTTPAAMGCLQLVAWQRGRIAGYVGLVLSGVVLLVWLATIWFLSSHEGRWFGTVLALGAFAALTTLCLVDVASSVRGRWRWAGVLGAVLGCCLTMAAIWSDSPSQSFMARLSSVPTSVAIVIVHANLTLLVPLRRGQVWIWWGTIASAIVTASCLSVAILWDLQGDSLVVRLTCAMAIVTGCGTLAVVVLERLNRLSSSHVAESHTAYDREKLQTITVFCPRCGLRQTIPFSEARCQQCSLRISVHVGPAITVGERSQQSSG